MAARREKTRTPGIYKRGSRYCFQYEVEGRQRWESARTLDEARRAKAARTADIARGEFEERSRVMLHEYAREWVGRYQGRGRRGFRDHTREEYRRYVHLLDGDLGEPLSIQGGKGVVRSPTPFDATTAQELEANLQQ